MLPNIRVRLYPPFGYSILYKEYKLPGFNHQKNRYSNGREDATCVTQGLGFRV